MALLAGNAELGDSSDDEEKGEEGSAFGPSGMFNNENEDCCDEEPVDV